MNTINASTGFSPFTLCFGVSMCRSPFLDSPASDTPTATVDIVERVAQIEKEAKDNLLATKISQTIQANAHRRPDQDFDVCNRVYLLMANQRKEYMHNGDDRVAKFMPRFNGPYEVIQANKEKSSYTLNMPNAENTFPTFHCSHLWPFIPNNGNLFPLCELERPAAVTRDSGDDEYYMDSIVDEKCGRRGMEYLVSFRGYGPEENHWMSRREVEELGALDRWLERPKKTPKTKTKKITAPVLLGLLESLTQLCLASPDSTYAVPY